jgi:aryl-alcohol dehydrogenase-like predicted oxidoreductase
MPERPLGRTGHRVRLFSLGGQATIEQPGTRDESVAIINRALDLGVNYIDTAAAYGRGISQTYIGEVMATRRNEVFLATKTHDRTRDGSLRLLEESLRLLQTDHLDLWQLHNISRTEQLDQIFGEDGAIEALQRARDEGTVRFLGITGHNNPEVLLDGLNRFDFDTILMALNPADKHHLPFTEELLPLANRKGMGVIGMKIPARGRIFRDGGITTMKETMTYVLSLPVSTVIVGCDDVAQLEENISIAANFQPLSSAEMTRIEGLTADYPMEAAFFKRDAAGFGRGGEDEDDQQTG